MRSFTVFNYKLLIFISLFLNQQVFAEQITATIESSEKIVAATADINKKTLPNVLPKKQIVTREVSNQVLKRPPVKIVTKKVVTTKITNRKSTSKAVGTKKLTPTKYRTLYVMVYKDKSKTHEFKFLKDVNNHKNTVLKLKTNKKIISKRLPLKDAIHIERNFSKIWGDTKFRSPSKVKKCTPYVNVASLLGKQVVCAENQSTAFQARNFLNELNMVFKASK